MAADTTIATLRLRTAVADSPALRLRAARQLQAAALSPAALPPAAVLVVRRLRDPLPGRVGGDRLRPHPDWERAVRDELSALARSAARPDAQGRLPANAESILFGDEAELVACLLADRARGEVPGRWWWRSVLPRLAIPRIVAADPGRDPAPILIARPRETPAAIRLLVRWSEAVRVAAALSPAGAVQALAALVRAHSLPAELVTPPGGSTVSDAPRSGPAANAAPRVSQPWDERRPPAVSPWAEWAPPGFEEGMVPPEVHCLFALAAAVHVAPGRVRSTAMVARAREWWAGVSAAAAGGETPLARRTEPSEVVVRASAMTASRQSTSVVHEPTAGAEPAQEGLADGVPSPSRAIRSRPRRSRDRRAAVEWNPPSVPAAAARRRVHEEKAAQLPRLSDTPPSAPPSALPPPAPRLRAKRRKSRATTATVARLDRRAAPPLGNRRTPPAAKQPAPAAHGPSTGVLPGEGLVTRLGGLFFLIHALEDLGLPEGFDARWRADEGGRWGTLDLLARALLGPRLAQLSADPAWTALAGLGEWGRHRKRAALAAGKCDPAFHIPAGWHERLRDPLDELRWAVARGRLWVWSANGYLVAHRRLRGDARASLCRETGRLRAEGAASAPRLERSPAARMPWTPPIVAPAGCPERLCRWAAAVAPALRRRLALALGAAAEVAAHLMVPARLHLTSSHVDVVMKAVDADLAVRAAGLDRDPGWRPAYGRVVYFHFE